MLHANARLVAATVLCLVSLSGRTLAASEDPTASVEAQAKEEPSGPEQILLGSYGRVATGSNAEGRSGHQVKLVAFPPRLLEGTYAELDVGYSHSLPTSDVQLRSQLTLALGEKLFHMTGDFAADIAIRNLYVEADGVLLPGMSIWAGSRMLRGDAIYLLDFWPLDEQNTVGGGVGYHFGDTRVSLHLGVNRLDDSFQTQTITVPGTELGTRDVLFLDRQRTVVTSRLEHSFAVMDDLTLKPVLYGEVHRLPSGTYRTADNRLETLPNDSGWLVGAELAAVGLGQANHVDLFARFGRGLAIYDELGVPFGLGTDKRAARAKELRLGLDGNFEYGGRFGLMAGGYTRYFVDADPNVYDRDDVWETALAVRPAWYVTDHVQLVGELNVQYQRPNGLSPETGRHEKPVAVQAGVMPTISLDRGNFSRPQLRLIYAATFMNNAATLTYAPEDPLRRARVQHYVGVNVEWWFNSSRYAGSDT